MAKCRQVLAGSRKKDQQKGMTMHILTLQETFLQLQVGLTLMLLDYQRKLENQERTQEILIKQQHLSTFVFLINDSNEVAFTNVNGRFYRKY